VHPIGDRLVIALAIIPEHWKQIRFNVHAVMILLSTASKKKAL
jgi:hypothetical protein